MGIDWDDYKNFSRTEFLCKCGCGRADMDPGFMANLQKVRQYFGRALVVTSGFRCPDHNDAVSHSGRDGPHTTGRAVDLAIAGEDAFFVIQEAIESGEFTGVGVKQKGAWGGRFIHLDNLENDAGSPRPRVWSY